MTLHTIINNKINELLKCLPRHGHDIFSVISYTDLKLIERWEGDTDDNVYDQMEHPRTMKCIIAIYSVLIFSTLSTTHRETSPATRSGILMLCTTAELTSNRCIFRVDEQNLRFRISMQSNDEAARLGWCAMVLYLYMSNSLRHCLFNWRYFVPVFPFILSCFFSGVAKEQIMVSKVQL